MRLRYAIIGCALLLGAVTISADHYSSFYVIPVASHTPGALNTLWMSDVAIQNFQTTPLIVDMTFVRSGDSVDNAEVLGAPVVVAAGGSVLLKDVLGDRGTSEAGAILIGSSAPFAVTSRSYVTTEDGDTVGQTVVPARDFLENAAGDTNNDAAVAYLPGLIVNSEFRTNLGFVAATSNPSAGMTIQVTIKRADGTTLGTRSFSIPPGAIRHYQFSSSTLGSGTFEVGSAQLRITAGDGAVVPYASVIDNGSADAVFVSGQFPPNITSSLTARGSAFRRFLFRPAAYE